MCSGAKIILKCQHTSNVFPSFSLFFGHMCVGWGVLVKWKEKCIRVVFFQKLDVPVKKQWRISVRVKGKATLSVWMCFSLLLFTVSTIGWLIPYPFTSLFRSSTFQLVMSLSYISGSELCKQNFAI